MLGMRTDIRETVPTAHTFLCGRRRHAYGDRLCTRHRDHLGRGGDQEEAQFVTER
jgi:hypothetical protein